MGQGELEGPYRIVGVDGFRWHIGPLLGVRHVGGALWTNWFGADSRLKVVVVGLRSFVTHGPRTLARLTVFGCDNTVGNYISVSLV